MRWIEWFGGTAPRGRNRIGKAHGLHVITTIRADTGPGHRGTRCSAVLGRPGRPRGMELEIVALDLADAIVVIHVMPTALRKGGHT